MHWFQKGTILGLLLLAALIGLGGAIGAALFHLLIHTSTSLFYGYDGSLTFLETLKAIPWWQRVLIPTLGGLLVGLLFKWAKVSEAEGEGVPEVMDALAHHKGTIRPIVAPVKIITAAITLGSGGSAGREGPVIQIGSTIGSSVAQCFKVKSADRMLLLAAGAAAGIAGTFGAPLAGILFTIEILRHKLTLKTILIVAVGASVSHFLSVVLFDNVGLRFSADTRFLYNLEAILIVGIVALAATAAAVLFSKSLSASKFLGAKAPFPHFLKPAVGGFLVGLIGLLVPYIHEPATYPLMVDALSITDLSLGIIFLILIIKMIATGITLGSGGSGGVFAPLLLIGALLGTLIVKIAAILGLTVLGTPIIILGMAAVFAAAAHAPLTAAVIVFEITGGYALLPALLFVCVVSAFISRKIKHKSIYALPV
jgi:CIC family chloride channel protein